MSAGSWPAPRRRRQMAQERLAERVREVLEEKGANPSPSRPRPRTALELAPTRHTPAFASFREQLHRERASIPAPVSAGPESGGYPAPADSPGAGVETCPCCRATRLAEAGLVKTPKS